MDGNDTKRRIADKARDLGFAACGFARAQGAGSDKVDLARFLAMGRHGDMGWMADVRGVRGDAAAMWPEARTAVCLGASYAPAADPRDQAAHKDRGWIAAYAKGRDYHDVLKKRLKALATWIADDTGAEVKVFVDTAPVMEKPLAARAGLGWQGKHTNLVSRAYGSWLFLAEVLTTLDLPPDEPHADLCGSCDACRQACPTDALAEPYKIEPRECISYLTIEHKGAIPPALMERMGNRIYGCDDCLAACPWNKFAPPPAEDAFRPRAELDRPRLADLAQLDDAQFRALFAGSPIKRTGRDRFVRNVAAAMGNAGDPAMVPVLERLAGDASPLVADAARWALGRLKNGNG